MEVASDLQDSEGGLKAGWLEGVKAERQNDDACHWRIILRNRTWLAGTPEAGDGRVPATSSTTFLHSTTAPPSTFFTRLLLYQGARQ